jgi:hypothetical protein
MSLLNGDGSVTEMSFGLTWRKSEFISRRLVMKKAALTLDIF